MTDTRLRLRRAFIAGIAGLALTVSVAACSSLPGSDTSKPAEPEPTSTADTGEEEPLVLLPDGTAEENLAFFRATANSVWESESDWSGQAYVDALVAAGFDKAAMQVTEDESTVGNRAESLQFSVKWKEECLVGQVGPSTGALVTKVLPPVEDGVCLIGVTREINW